MSDAIQTFEPTIEQFRNFPKYVEYMESHGAHRAGIARVIPPKEWSPRKNHYDTDDVMHFKIQNPIDQKASGKQGIFTLWNIARCKSLEVKKFKELAESKKFTAPVQDYDELEKRYWQSLAFNANAPVYGADTPGSFYDADVDAWNINRLGTILSEGIKGQKIEGVNTAYLYFGMWRSTFCWHTEDMDLYSINYLHHGEPKFWYAIPPEHSERFERMACGIFAQAKKSCPQFLRHKMYLVSPVVLKSYKIPYDKVVQHQGQFIITFPRGYHSGFNLGYNIAESTNFASLRWIDYGKQAEVCECKEDSVRINMEQFVHIYQPDLYEEWKTQNDKKMAAKNWSKFGHCMGSSKRHPVVRTATKKKSVGSFKRLLVELDQDSGNSSSTGTDDEGRVICEPSTSDERAPSGDPTSSPKNTKTANTANIKDWDLEDSYHFGLWSKPLEHLWQFKICDLKAEIAFNVMQALIEPHCCVCQYFVPRPLERKLDKVPESSRRILTDLCFSRKADTLVPMEEGEEMDNLLTCCSCSVTVHAKCYGVRLKDCHDRSSWLCARCKMGSTTAECQLCNLRGGALRHSPEYEWVHVICALFCPGTVFNYDQINPNILLKSRSDSYLSKVKECVYCNMKNGQPVTCGHALYICRSVFHITCGYFAGASFELRDWPTMVQAVCGGHNGLAGSPSTLADGETTPKYALGEFVLAKRGDDYVKGRIAGSQTETLCVVEFDDGSFSNNIYVEDVVECKCSNMCKGAHTAGARVKINWVADGQLYGAVFKRAYHVVTYNVRLENGEFDRCTEDELFKSYNDLPVEAVARKKAKFTKAEKKFLTD